MKRAHIQKLIYNIFQDSSQKAPSSDCIDKNPPSKVLGFVKHSADSFMGSCRPTLSGGDSFCSAKQGTDIQFPAASPANFTCIKEPGSFFKDLQGAVVNSSSANCQQVLGSHRRGFMSTIEVNEFKLFNFSGDYITFKYFVLVLRDSVIFYPRHPCVGQDKENQFVDYDTSFVRIKCLVTKNTQKHIVSQRNIKRRKPRKFFYS